MSRDPWKPQPLNDKTMPPAGALRLRDGRGDVCECRHIVGGVGGCRDSCGSCRSQTRESIGNRKLGTVRAADEALPGAALRDSLIVSECGHGVI